MPKHPKKPELIHANLSYQQMKSAITKIERRLEELKQFDISSITQDSDSGIMALGHKLDSFLADTFGNNSVEYNRYNHIINLYKRININLFRDPSIAEIQAGFKNGLDSAIVILETIKSDFQEKLQDAKLDSGTKAIRAYEGLELHPAITSAADQLYRNEHYSNAIEDSVKALNSLVKQNSGIDDKDGVSLMQHVFSPNNPVLKFNDLKDESDKNEQQGFMSLFVGAITGLRNPRAHKIIKDDPEMALEFIAFVSLLAKLADKAKKTRL